MDHLTPFFLNMQEVSPEVASANESESGPGFTGSVEF